MTEQLLLVTPSDLAFQFEAGAELQSALCLRNPHSDRRIGFKLKTTDPLKYAVTPSAGILEPTASRVVKVFLEAQPTWTDELVGAILSSF